MAAGGNQGVTAGSAYPANSAFHLSSSKRRTIAVKPIPP